MATSASDALRAQYAAPDLRTWLYVGRIAPNKRIEDVIRSFHYYRERIEPKSRLFLVGGRREGVYDGEIVDLIARLGLMDAVGAFPGSSGPKILGGLL